MLQPKDTGLLNGYKNKTYIYAVYKRLTSEVKTNKDKVRRWKKDISCKWKQQENWVATLIPKKLDFKTKSLTKDKEGHYIMIKGSIQDEDITLVNIYSAKTGAFKYIKQILTDIKEKLTIQ